MYYLPLDFKLDSGIQLIFEIGLRVISHCSQTHVAHLSRGVLH